jgi:predicted permease
MKVPLLRGRTFTAADRSDAAAVVVVNNALAQRLFPGGDALGHRIIFRQGQLPWREIVGVVGDTRDNGLDRPVPPTVFLPFTQKQDNWRWMSWQTLVVRTAGDPVAGLPAIRRAVWSIDPELPLIDARPVLASYAIQLSQRRFALGMLIACAALALVLGAIGIYGVLACAVAERRREIGIRRALGASATHVVGAVVRSALCFAATGALAGIAVALTLTRFLAPLLFQVEPRDPATFAAAAALLIGVATLAAWLPARRATRLDPMETLRENL